MTLTDGEGDPGQRWGGQAIDALAAMATNFSRAPSASGFRQALGRDQLQDAVLVELHQGVE